MNRTNDRKTGAEIRDIFSALFFLSASVDSRVQSAISLGARKNATLNFTDEQKELV